MNTRLTAILDWMSQVTSPLDIGVKAAKGPVHAMRNSEVEEYLKANRLGEDVALSVDWSASKIRQQSDGTKTWYFTSHQSNRYGLIMIDVDCHKTGTHEAAMDYCEMLKREHFPDLYFEPSTNGTGAHAYLIVKYTRSPRQEDKLILLRKLQPILRELAEGFDVELVEIKGLPPTGSDKPGQEFYVAGTLAKLPRGIYERFEELTSTTRVDLSAIFYDGRGKWRLPCEAAMIRR